MVRWRGMGGGGEGRELLTLIAIITYASQNALINEITLMPKQHRKTIPQ